VGLIEINYLVDLSYSFNGIVQNLSYAPTRYLVVTIKGEQYDLDYNHWIDREPTIRVGGVMIKRKGTMNLYLVLRNTNDTTNLLDPASR